MGPVVVNIEGGRRGVMCELGDAVCEGTSAVDWEVLKVQQECSLK